MGIDASVPYQHSCRVSHWLQFFPDTSAVCFVWYKCPDHWVHSRVNTGKVSCCVKGWWNRSNLSLLALVFSWLVFPSQLPGAQLNAAGGEFAVFFQTHDKISARAARGRLECPGAAKAGSSVEHGMGGRGWGESSKKRGEGWSCLSQSRCDLAACFSGQCFQAGVRDPMLPLRPRPSPIKSCITGDAKAFQVTLIYSQENYPFSSEGETLKRLTRR